MTREAVDHEPAGGQLDGEAAGWCSLMHGADAELHRPDFENWLRRGALHRQAYNRMEELYLLGAKLPPRLLAEPLNASRLRRPPLLAGIAAVAVVGLAVLPIARRSSLEEKAPGVAAADGNVQLRLSTMRVSSETFRLADGSVVTLGPDSELAVDFTVRSRRLELARGRSRFDVTQQRRPFVVKAGPATLTAQRSSFGVAIDARRAVQVLVQSGEVEVRRAAEQVPGDPERLLTAGDQLVIAPHASDQRGPGEQPNGRSEGQPTTVGELVDQANRKAKGGPLLRVIDPTLLTVRLGGRFQAHAPPIVAERLAALLDLTVERRPGEIILRRRR